LTDAYYELVDPSDPLGEKFSASDHAISTWSPTMQNAAPVSALLVRALERCSSRGDARLSRVVVDLLGPVPVTDQLWVRARVDRPGNKIELLNAQMLAPGPNGQPRPVATAMAWRFQEVDAAELFFSPAPPLRPVSEGRPRNPDSSANQTYIQSLDWRWLNDILNDVPGECWARPVVDLVKGESMTPMERLFAVADIANGMSSRLDPAEWLFLNTDLVVHIHRVPDGEWVGLRAENHYGRDGVGVSIATLFDEQGPVAAVQQAQLVRRR
jgi:hypothetical protein